MSTAAEKALKKLDEVVPAGSDGTYYLVVELTTLINWMDITWISQENNLIYTRYR